MWSTTNESKSIFCRSIRQAQSNRTAESTQIQKCRSTFEPGLRTQSSKNIENTENTELPKRCNKLQKAQEYTRGESFWFILLNES